MTRSSTRSTIVRKAGLIATAAMVAVASACSNDSPVAPEVTAKNGLVGSLLSTVTGLLFPAKALTRDSAIVSPITRSFTVTRNDGGRIDIAQAGLRVDVPAGAISTSSLTITVTVLPGRAIAYDFQPHGTKFLKPLVFRQELLGTSWAHAGFNGTLNGGYFKETSQINLLSGLSLLDELFPVQLGTHEARFNINHFSGYMVSGGRKGSAYYDDNDSF